MIDSTLSLFVIKPTLFLYKRKKTHIDIPGSKTSLFIMIRVKITQILMGQIDSIFGLAIKVKPKLFWYKSTTFWIFLS